MQKSADKDFIVVEGATTGVTPCTNYPMLGLGLFECDVELLRYAAQWINVR
jgi:hypothetical protein